MSRTSTVALMNAISRTTPTVERAPNDLCIIKIGTLTIHMDMLTVRDFSNEIAAALHDWHEELDRNGKRV